MNSAIASYSPTISNLGSIKKYDFPESVTDTTVNISAYKFILFKTVYYSQIPGSMSYYSETYYNPTSYSHNFSLAIYKYNNNWYCSNLNMDTYAPFEFNVSDGNIGVKIRYHGNNSLLITSAATSYANVSNTSKVSLIMICL